ncbi:hypothetical protein Bbelb_081490 [Branchiostoma belcheri]|nr:hypothetical protein Bbelb_081490 [Branchiostoma belcheri]
MSYSPVVTQRAKMKKRGNNCNNNRPLSDEPQLRVAVVGDSSVGKSALSVRFLARRFLPEYAPAQELRKALESYAQRLPQGTYPDMSVIHRRYFPNLTRYVRGSTHHSSKQIPHVRRGEVDLAPTRARLSAPLRLPLGASTDPSVLRKLTDRERTLVSPSGVRRVNWRRRRDEVTYTITGSARETPSDDPELLYERQVAVDGHLIPLVVHDTASQQVSSPSSIFQADGVLVLYSITNRRSFDTAKSYLEIIATEPGLHNLPTVLVGHKSDLQHLRQVAYTQAQQLAWDVGCSFYEVSSESGTESVDHVFHTLIRQVLASRQRRKLSSGSSKDRRQRSNSITSNLWRKTRAAILEKLRRDGPQYLGQRQYLFHNRELNYMIPSSPHRFWTPVTRGQHASSDDQNLISNSYRSLHGR